MFNVFLRIESIFSKELGGRKNSRFVALKRAVFIGMQQSLHPNPLAATETLQFLPPSLPAATGMRRSPHPSLRAPMVLLAVVAEGQTGITPPNLPNQWALEAVALALEEEEAVGW